MPATDTSATVTVADVEKAQGARQTRFDDEVQTAPGARVAWWARVGQCVRHGMSAATAAMHWSENRTSSASSSSGATSGTGSREGRPSPMRRSTQSTVASGPGERANDDTHDPTPVNLVVVDFATAPEPAEAGAESDSLSEHTETPVASRYTARSGDHSNPVVVAALWMKNVLVRKGWPLFKSYCDSSFPDKHQESVFQHELWYVDKRPALLCSLSLIAEFALILGLMTPKNDFWSYWGYVVIVGGFTLPVPLMILFNGPRRFSWIYQTFLLGAGWSLGFMATIELYHCLRENRDNMSICGTGGAIVFITGPLFALPTLTLMAMRQNRMLNLFMAMTYLVFSSITVSVAPNNALASARTLFTVALYFVILTYLNYTREQGQRQMFVMRYELKRQCKTAQLAQEMERRANQSKKRFVSYIFHEVRVPLNTALLAVQNLEGEGVFKNLSEDHSEMIYGLMGSLTIMEKVLNDVLSFNRMEAGKFSLESNPFDFHRSIQVVSLSYRVLAERSGVGFTLDLDPRIDTLEGTLIGDDMRLRQVVSNLVSNALKFTEAGSVKVVTRLVSQHPRGGRGSLRPPDIAASPNPSNHSDPDSTRPKPSTVVVRVEVHDTGVGLSSHDVTGAGLFSPYVQTEIGRRQGGKGSGLGLALVRQIVTLSKGRLGVESQVGKGSNFWFELPYTLVPGQVLPEAHFVPMEGRRPSHVLPDLGWRPSPRLTTVAQLAEPTVGGTTPTLGGTPPTLGDPSPSHEPNRSSDAAPDAPPPPPPLPPGKAGTLVIGTDRGADVSSQLSPISWGTLTPLPSASISDCEGLGLLDRLPRRFEHASNAGHEASSTPPFSPPPQLTPPPQPTPPPRISPPPASPPASTPADGGAPLNVLIVDDDPLTRKLMARMLQRLGHAVVGTAENGGAALSLIKASFEGQPGAPEIDMVFLDNQMPVMSGVEVTREVRRIGCPVFIVGCTGNALREDQDEYLEAGADGLITKPIHQAKLVAMVAEARRRVDGGDERPVEQ